MALVMLGAGCGRNAASVDATGALQAAFQTAAPEVQQTIQTVNHHLRAGDYTAAARSLAPVALERPLSPQERQAVAQALEQINRGVAANPAQDTRELYELRAKLFQAIHRGGPRF
jgi:RNA polymerase-interacting CarD/CdnL/TRCF family regulator